MTKPQVQKNRGLEISGECFCERPLTLPTQMTGCLTPFETAEIVPK